MTLNALATACFLMASITACSSGQLATSNLSTFSSDPALPASMLNAQRLSPQALSRQLVPSYTGALVFSDTFEQDALNSAAQRWSPISGIWKVCQPAGESHEYCQSSSSQAIAIPTVPNSDSWTDYQVDADFLHATAPGSVALLARMQDASHFYKFKITSNGTGTGQSWYLDMSNGRDKELAGGTLPSSAVGTVVHARLVLKGTSITVYASEANVLTQLATVLDSAYMFGGMGIRTNGIKAVSSFDNVSVTLPGSVASPSPQPTTASGAHADVVAGCQLFPASDFWNLDIYRAPPDANSAAMMATAISGSNDSTLSNVYQSQSFNVVPYNEGAGTVHPTADHKFPAYTGSPSNGWPIGTGSPQFVRGGGDSYIHILQTAGGGHPCWLWSIYDASYAGVGLSAYGGAGYPLNVPVTQNPPGCTNSGSCNAPGSTYMMQRPFHARVDEIIAGQITHAIDGEFPVSSICSSQHLYPALSSAQGNRSSNCLPGAAKIRLKASYDTSGLSGDGLVVANGLKHFGIAVMDNGCCFGLYFGKQQAWDSRNIDVPSVNAAMNAIHMSDFEVLKLGPTDGSFYAYPGSAP